MKKIIGVLGLSLFLTACGRTPGTFDSLAQCMTDNGVVMYGQDTCPHCQNQKEAFKGSFELINYVQCDKEPALCAEIEGVPTWEVDGKMYAGERSLSELAELSGCELQ